MCLAGDLDRMLDVLRLLASVVQRERGSHQASPPAAGTSRALRLAQIPAEHRECSSEVLAYGVVHRHARQGVANQLTDAFEHSSSVIP